MKTLNLLYEFCNKFQYAISKENKKKVIIGGYDLYGAYCNWLLRKTRGRPADIIIDDNLCVYGVNVKRELALEIINPEDYIGIVPNEKKYADMFTRNGIKALILEDIFGCEKFGFYEWLEKQFGVDLVKTINKETFDYDYTFATNSGASRQMGLVDVIVALEVKNLIGKDQKALDVGCGKGGAIVLMSQSFFSRVDGIELSPSICKIARKNMELLNINTEITNVSATEFDKYDEYDVLYLYDPFRGEVFKEVLSKIESAAKKRKNPMLLVYANPYHHKDIVAGGVFSLVTTVDTDFFHRDVYIYSSAGGK